MAKQLSIEQFLPLTDALPLVDVRSPKEYAQGHILGAINIPLFDNEERKLVGIRYKQGGQENAVLLGLEIVGPKLTSIVKQAKKIARQKKILMHCWRGGMRSGSMAWLFEIAGLNATTLEGGYKAYRQYIRQRFASPAKIVILGGSTGSGKTAVLKELIRQGEQVLDIEAIACHKGSVFGPLGEKEQPTNEQFENNLADAWRKFDFSKPLFMEDESRQLGRCAIPEPLYLQIRNRPVIKMIIPKPVRVLRLVKEYGHFDKPLLSEQLKKINERLGGQNTKVAITALEKGELTTVADISLQYYDKAYKYGIEKRDRETVFELPLTEDNPAINAMKVKKIVQQLKI